MAHVYEKTDDYTYIDHGKVLGQITYQYHSDTHWATSGICRVGVDFDHTGKPRVSFSYGAGGTNAGHTPLELAKAMTEAFTLAAQRLEVLAALGYESN